MVARAIQPLCYEHHFPMTLPGSVIVSPDLVAYACPYPGCSICYQVSRGYFTGAPETANPLLISAPPRIPCPVDSHPMYLAETQREYLSYRLWRCPICGASSVGGDLPVSSH